jgi:hypothetical protein
MDPEDELLEDDQLDLDEDQLEDDPDPDLDDQDQDDALEGDDLPPPQRQSRGESRAQKLSREANELRESNRRMAERLEALERRPAPASGPTGETQEQFNARMNAMDPADRALYLQNLHAQNTNAEIQGLRFQIADGNDRSSFEAMCASNAQAKKYQEQVETKLVEYRKQGLNIPRKDVLRHILGDLALRNSERSTNRTRKDADQRRQQQQGRPASSRSDASGEGRQTSERAAREKRLDNMKF